jgi:NAD(P)-dependent dehydrogenase (short-subunit alcohol dehydrogenase family)
MGELRVTDQKVRGSSPFARASSAVPDVQQTAAASPLGLLGRPDEVTATVAWLISPAYHRQ